MTAASPITEFMQSPLVTWIKTFSEEESKTVHFQSLCDGVFLHDVMLQIDSRPPYRGVSLAVDDITVRIRNLDILVRNVRAFYEDALGQLVITKLPDLIALSKDPETDSSLDDVKGLLLLILGCAVQCDKKEQFIERIKQLDVEVQHAIVECIQQVTDNPETVWTQEWSDLSLLAEEHHEPTFQLLVQHLRRLVKERDELWHNCNTLVLEKEGGEKCTTPAWSGSPGSISDKHHLGVELADSKAKLRRLRQELEEKNELLAEIKEELEQSKGLVNKLRQENLDLLQDARAAKAYRDELDILRERVSKVDKLENEIQRYKDKLNELEFYKSRVEELREDNRILVETKEMLEDQLESSRKRADLVLDLENELLRYKAQINEFTLERDADRDRIQELIEENSQLQLSTKHSMNESVNLMAELDQLRSQGSPGLGDSLSDELNKDAQSRLRKLELENQRLLNIIENLRVSSFHENSEKVLELEKENKRLSLKVAQLQDSGTRELQRCLEAEHRQQELTQEATKLQDMLEAVKTNSERQWIELQREKEALVELVDTLRHRNQKSNDARLKDIEAENKKLVESTQEMKGQISRLEYEKQQLQKVNEKLKENSERLSEIESQKLEVDRENADLHRAIAAFKLACDKYEKLEQDFSDLQVEYCRLNRVLENMKNTCTKIDELEQSNISLVIEKQKLTKTLDSLRASSQKLVDLEQEKEELKQTNQLLRRNIEALKVDRGKFEQMELDLMSLNTENQKLQKSLETTTKKIEEIENENQSLENENQKLQKTIETLKVSTRRFNDLERENTDLEADNHKLEREKKSLEKEVARLKQAIEVKDCTIDDCSSRVSTLERESKRLTKDLENVNHLNCRVKELEKENREIMQQSVIDKKTLIALREDLVNEKIKTQQLSNELEKLNSDLQKIGLKKEKLMVAEQTQDEDRYKALENMMEEALKKSLEIKEEKIHSLEKHLEELTSHNVELKEELVKLRQQYEAMQQEDQCASQADRQNEKEATASVTKEISDLKDHLEEIERTNSSLQEENRNLRVAVTNAREQLNSLQQQMASLQHQSAVLSEQNGSLQSLNAKLQVENTTLQSQNTSLSSQTTNLSAQYASLEADREQLLHHQEELQTAHELLVSDHEALQKLHEQLSSEYESLLNELGSQKSSQKTLKSEFKNLKEKYQVLITAQDEVAQLQDILEKERELLKSDSKSLTNLRAEHSRLKEDFRLLHTNNEKLKIEYKSLQVEYKTLKTENNTLKLKHTELQGELAECRDHMNGLDVEVSKLHSKCEMLSHVNATLEEDRKSLMTQVSTLLTQYHELLTQTLEDKGHFHEEEKSFADKLNNLQRQKEKLEEKIMEQYRRMENYSPENPSINMLRTLANDGEGLRGFGANLVRRVRRAGSELMNRVPRSARSKDRDKDRSRRSRDSTDATDSLDTVSVGSGSLSTESPDSGSDATIRKLNEDTRDFRRNDSLSDITDQSSKRRSTTSLNTLHMYKQLSSNIVNGDDNEKSMTGLPQVGNDLSTKELSLGNPGTRRAVCYADEHDTIPTRDVGPHVESSNNKKHQDGNGSLKNGTQSTMNSDLEMLNPDQTRIVCNLTPENNLKSTKSDSLNSSGWLIHSGSRNSLGSLPPTLTSSPILGNRMASSYSLISKCESLNDAVPSYLSKGSIWHNNCLDGSPAPNSEHNDQSKPQRQNSTENGLVETSSTATTATPSASPLHNRHSRLLQESPPLTNDLTSRNNNLSPNLSTRRPNLLTVQQPRLPNNTKALPDKTSNIVASTGNLARDKPPDNSIWYEYGCV